MNLFRPDRKIVNHYVEKENFELFTENGILVPPGLRVMKGWVVMLNSEINYNYSKYFTVQKLDDKYSRVICDFVGKYS
jgi:hypothetical protein